MNEGYRRIVTAVNELVTGRPLLIVAAFLVLTGVFAGGLAAVEADPDIDAFTEGIPEQDALDRVNEEFEPAFEDEETSVQLIQEGDVLSRNGVLAMLEVKHRLEDHSELDVRGSSSVAAAVAEQLDEDAETTEAQLRAVEDATDTEVRVAARAMLAEQPGRAQSLSDDLNTVDPSASATIAVIDFAEAPDTDAEMQLLTRMETVADGVHGDFTVFTGALVDIETEQAMIDSLVLVVPAVSGLILLFLIVAYRDPFDLTLGLIALVMAVIWTFGFAGLAGIPFTMMTVAVPPLLLAVGIDFGIHAVNRYREERVQGYGIREAMRRANDQLLVAFFIVTGTTAIGFGANLTSELGQIQEFGLVTAIGIVFTLLIFGVFVPATKVLMDEYREGTSIPEFGTTPLGDEDSVLGRVLPVGLFVGRKAPMAMLAVILVATAGAGVVATDVETEFDDEDFLPYEELPPYVAVTGVVDADDYRATESINFLSDNFETGQDDQVTIYIEGPADADHSLESAYRAGTNPPDTFLQEDGQALAESVLDPMNTLAAQDPEFAALVEANDMSGNGVPDRNVDQVMDELLASPVGDWAEEYVTEDRTAMRFVYDVEADATEEAVVDDARSVADDYREDAIATGDIVVIRSVMDLLFASAIVSLATALGVTAVFLVAVYWVLERRPSLGIVNVAPIVVTVAFLAATMVVLDIPFNVLTATILSITIGIGIAYSVHITHRFIDEFNEAGDAETALLRTLRGTGGGVTGSMVTTTGGVGALVLSATPLLAQFGLLTSLSVIYSFLAAVLVLPPALLVWERYCGWTHEERADTKAETGAEAEIEFDPRGDEVTDA
ncbi:MAG: MMPL family transporter [Halorubrum sp.]